MASGARVVGWAAGVLAMVAVQADATDVFNMGGTRNADGSWNGLARLEFVTVGHPGNAGEPSGEGAGGYGPSRVCGAVNYTYQIAKYEITNAQYRQFLNAVAAYGDPYNLYSPYMGGPDSSGRDVGGIARSGAGTQAGPYVYTAKNADPNWDNRPVNWVSWGDAARFCNWLTNGQPTATLAGNGAQDGNVTEAGSYALNGATTNDALMAITRAPNARYVIPSEDEWYKAAYYDPTPNGGAGGYWDYPTGTDSTPSNDLLTPDGGNNGNFLQSGYTLGSPYYTTVTGEFELSESPYGTFDQGGNVAEWNEADIYGSFRGLRGGACHYDDEFSLRASWRLQYNGPLGENCGVGFRVVEVPEPTTLALLALAGSALLARWKRRGLA